MMRRSQTSGVAGNCSCCLVPALILFAIIVAAVIGVAVVWQTAMPTVFRGDYAHRHHYNAYRDGYEQGNKLGADYARRGDPEPTGQDLDALALREADRLHVRRDRRQWIEGFRNGFTRGFEEFNNQASNQQVSWSRLATRPVFPADIGLIGEKVLISRLSARDGRRFFRSADRRGADHTTAAVSVGHR